MMGRRRSPGSTRRPRACPTPRPAERLVGYGPNTLQEEAKPSRWRVALGQLVEPMNLMLVAVAVVSILIGQGSTAAVVLTLVLLERGAGNQPGAEGPRERGRAGQPAGAPGPVSCAAGP